MGAAEWTGYSSPTVGTTYASFQHPSSYDQANSSVLPGDAATAYTPSADFHCGSSPATAAAYNNSQFTSLSSWPASNEMEQYNYGYNGYQYACQSAAPAQYPAVPTVQPPPPTASAQTTMVLYPQLYSTVNQNQIHLHLHGSEKFIEYLGNPPFQPSNALDNGTAPTSFSVPPPLHGSSRQLALENGETDLIQQDDNSVKQQEHAVVDNENGEQVVWRPYWIEILIK